MSNSQHPGLRPFDVVAATLVISVAISALAVAVDVLRFEIFAIGIRQEARENDGRLAVSRRRSASSQAERWIGVGPVAGRVRSLKIDMALASDAPDTLEVETALLNLIERKPTYGSSWMSLAQIRMVNGAAATDVAPLVRMSVIMAPHDGHVMVPRAVFGIENWAVLNAAEKARTISDIRSLMTAQSDGFQWPILAEALDQQPEATRTDLRNSLQTGRPDRGPFLKELGL